MRKGSRRGTGLAALLAAALVVGQPGVTYALITGASINFNPANSADNFQDGTFASFERRSVRQILTNNGTTLATRYSFVNGTDSGLATDQSNGQTCDYRVEFNVTAPGGYRLTVNTNRNGALTRVDDGADATADISGVSASYTGSGTFSGGPLTLGDPPVSTGSGNANTAFDASTAVATITGVSNGAAVPQRFDFSWTTSCNSDSTSIFNGGDECAVRGGIAISYSGESAGDYPGSGGRTIDLDGHFLTVTFESLCGNSMIDAGVGEQCDEGGANGTPGSCCSSSCQFKSAGTTCRGVAGACDVAETCTGSGANCPADTFVGAGVVCRAASPGMVCDFEETCTGSAASCPTDVALPEGTVCRASAGICDLADVCDGVAKTCPSDAKVPNGTTCRPSAGVCDVAEACNGVSNNCPANGFASAATPCRTPVGDCDQQENCPGNAATCPADVLKPNGAACTSDGNLCTADQCNGVSTACQHPAGNAGAQCRPAAGDCDLAEVCDGSSTTCPADDLAPNGTTCRAASAGALCDESEVCTGSSITCPLDGVKPNGTVCRPAPGDCDVPESCDGSSKFCPTDAFEPASTVCRASGDVDCDVAENCTGSDAACPADVVVPDGTDCSDALFCNGTEACASGACQTASAACGLGESCDESTDQCFAGGCPTSAATCRSAQKSIVVIKDKPDNTRDKLVWKWIKGESTSQTEFGDPTTTADYALCIYSGPSASLIGNAEVGSGAGWSPISTKGYKYKDITGSQDGITKIVVKGSDVNKAKALVKGKGDGLPDLSLPIPNGDLPVVVQLRNNQTGICWEGVFATPTKNVEGLFKDRTP